VHLRLETADGAQAWDTEPNDVRLLGVHRLECRGATDCSGRVVNPTDARLDDVVVEEAVYDLFAADCACFEPGRQFRLTATFADGCATAPTTAIPAPPPAP
jgi:hypothetical protein